MLSAPSALWASSRPAAIKASCTMHFFGKWTHTHTKRAHRVLGSASWCAVAFCGVLSFVVLCVVLCCVLQLAGRAPTGTSCTGGHVACSSVHRTRGRWLRWCTTGEGGGGRWEGERGGGWWGGGADGGGGAERGKGGVQMVGAVHGW